jgi:TatD DNase family protein
LIDSHAHLDVSRFDGDRDAAIQRARDAGVELIVNPAVDLESSRRVLDLALRHECLLAAVGLDRDAADTLDEAVVNELIRLAADDRCVAIGEIGLDYYYDKLPRDEQRRAFETQLELAVELDLPAIIHCRDAFDDALPILERTRARGVMHCFSGDTDTALRCCDLGLMISFSGTITFAKADALRETARAIPAEHLLIETDCPYLAPEPLRGRRNEPAFVEHVARSLAETLGLTFSDVDRITTTNAKLLFGLPLHEETAVVYPIRDSLYVNLTNRCTNACVFCPRSSQPRVKGHWLGMGEEDEPAAADVIELIGDPSRYDEIVFCGFGEPTLRLGVMLNVARWVKEHGGRTRLNTNGQGELIAGAPVAPRLAGVFDAVSVSLNTADPEQYVQLSQSHYGRDAWDAVLAFIRACTEHVPEVVCTALDYPGVDIAAVQQLADELGVKFRLRTYRHLG